MHILGISAFYHDSAAALIRDGLIVAAAQEERFTRIRHDSAFPENAIRYCLREANVDINDVDHIVYYEKPFVKFDRLLETYLAFAPKGFRSFRQALPIWLKEKLFQKRLLTELLTSLGGNDSVQGKLLFTEHHHSHAASAFFASPFDEAAILTMDGVGEWTTTSISHGKRNELAIKKEIYFPHSIGLLYSAFTYYTGFKVNSGEYKVMGLAPYGVPKYKDLIFKHLVDLKPDGSFHLDMKYFDYCTGLVMTNSCFEEVFGGKARDPEEPVQQKHMDLAASIQAATEEIVLTLTKEIKNSMNQDYLCLAGGVALNCVANGKVRREKLFKNVWVQPASGDSGGALGAALAAYYNFRDNPRKTNGTDSMSGAFLGPQYSQDFVEKSLSSLGARFSILRDEELLESTVRELKGGKAVGWFQGRMEFGPRALGARSILGDARSPTMQRTLNLKVKKRESFRPFAPSILAEDVQNWFETITENPYMLFVEEVKSEHRIILEAETESLFGIEKLNVMRSTIPAVTHVDYSARLQTVHKETNPRFYQLLTKFKEQTGCPLLVNTSFNVRGEPIVCTPEDAFQCFMSTDIDALAIENCFLLKHEQDSSLTQKFQKSFALD